MTVTDQFIKCISVQQPWAWAIFHGGKNFENRTWHTRRFIDAPLLIHASMSKQRESAVDVIRSHGIDCPDFKKLARGCVIGVVHHVGCWHISRMQGCPVEQDWYAEGPWCHVYQKQFAFDNPVGGRGHRGLFDVYLEDVRNQMSKMPNPLKEFYRALYKDYLANTAFSS